MDIDVTTFGKYRLVKEIGRGAMGVVYLAFDTVLERQVAIKTIAANSSRSEFRQRFIREAKSAARLRHPNIITVHDFGEEKDKLFIVMEYLEGIDLDQLIALRHPMDIKDRLRIVCEICDGVHFAHTNGVIHRDLKPSNIKIQADGHVKILDFGLSVMEDSSLTQSRMVLGTPNFIAPERIKGEPSDSRADQFAIGLIFYELLSGQSAFNAETIPAMLFQILNAQPFRLAGDLAEKFPMMNQIISRAIRKEPKERFLTVLDLAMSLNALKEQIQQTAVCKSDFLPISELRYGEECETLIESTSPIETQTIIKPKMSPKGKWGLRIIALIVLPLLFWIGVHVFSPEKDVNPESNPINEKVPKGFVLLDAIPYISIEKVTSLPDEAEVDISNLSNRLTPIRLELPVGKYRLEGLSGEDRIPIKIELMVNSYGEQHKVLIPDPDDVRKAVEELSVSVLEE